MEVQIEWRVALSPDARKTLHRTILDSFKHWTEVGGRPAKAIVSRPSFDPYDERIDIEIRDEAGILLGGGQIAVEQDSSSVDQRSVPTSARKAG